MSALTLKERFRGCLLGGALGDALGAPVEFQRASQIDARYGEDGPDELDSAYGRRGAITDDTQMTIFTAEGLIRADARWSERGVCQTAGVVFEAYQRWLRTQGEDAPLTAGWPEGPDGWLLEVQSLYARRAPGLTCLGSLRTGRMGTIAAPLNNSKGCGGVMRVAPVGLLAKDAFGLAAEIAALTHGHPSGYLPAGYLADLIRRLVREQLDLPEAARLALSELADHPGAAETSALVERALDLATQGTPDRLKLSSLGEGWTGEEALAMALYCALTAHDFRSAVRLAVNHSGDSDSTGAICGNILGALWGEQKLPSDWLHELELRTEITILADDLYAYSQGEVYSQVGGGRDEQGRIIMTHTVRSPEQERRYPAC